MKPRHSLRGSTGQWEFPTGILGSVRHTLPFTARFIFKDWHYLSLLFSVPENIEVWQPGSSCGWAEGASGHTALVYILYKPQLKWCSLFSLTPHMQATSVSDYGLQCAKKGLFIMPVWRWQAFQPAEGWGQCEFLFIFSWTESLSSSVFLLKEHSASL